MNTTVMFQRISRWLADIKQAQKSFTYAAGIRLLIVMTVALDSHFIAQRIILT